MKKLSKTQQELLDAIKSNTQVFFMAGRNAYAFRGDTHKSCTKTVTILLEKGLVKKVGENWKGWRYEAVKEQL